jgi:hypothetical protein
LNDTFELPEESTPVSLADEATETKCVIHSGEVVKIGKKSYKMPDGSMRASIKDCKLEVGSSMIFEYTDKKEPQFVNTKPRKKVHETLTIPIPLPDIESTPTSVNAYVTEIPYTSRRISNKFSKIDPLTAALLGIAILASIGITIFANFANAKTAKLKRFAKAKIDRFDELRKKKKEEQKKCNGKSDNLKSLISEVDLIIDHSVVQEIKVEQSEDFIQKVKDLNKEIIEMNKKINKFEDKITKVKSKKTTYTKGR